MMKVIKCIGLFLLAFVNIAYGQSPEPEYFIDHYHIRFQQSKTFTYAIPTAQHYLQCNQDGPGADLGSIEWKYKGTSFKNQIGNFQSITLIRNDMQYGGRQEAPGQFIDSSGELVFTNLSNTDLYITCRYSLTIN